MKHYRKVIDVTEEQLRHLLDAAAQMKAGLARGERPQVLAGRVLALIFEKPSLRTRASFESAIAQLGGNSFFLGDSDGGLGKREPVADFARTLSEYVDVVALRVFRQSTVEEFAQHASIPVINALSDRYHPCQALGDLLTIQEHFNSLKGLTVTFIGDGNNVARSLAAGCGLLGIKFILSAPDGYRFEADFLNEFRLACPKGTLQSEPDPMKAVARANVVYTDVWTSMGQEAEHQLRLQQFSGYQVNAALMSRAPKDAVVMHCLPAKRGEEISADVVDGPRSIVFPQAGNRMHAQKALLRWLLGL